MTTRTQFKAEQRENHKVFQYKSEGKRLKERPSSRWYQVMKDVTETEGKKCRINEKEHGDGLIVRRMA